MSVMNSERSSATASPAGLAWRGAVAGVLAGILALCVGQLVAGFTSADASPVVAVGQLSIDFTPPPVKNFAISAFGSHDKQVLVSGILVILAAIAALIGVLATRSLRRGMAGLAVFAVVGVVAAATRPTAGADAVLPTLIGAAAAAVALPWMIRAAGRVTADRAAAAADRARPPVTPPPAAAGPDAGSSPGEGPGPELGADRDPGADWVPPTGPQPPAGQPAGPPAGQRAAGPPAGPPPAAPPSPPGRSPVGPPPPGTPRRRFLTAGTVVAGSAAVTYALGRKELESAGVAAAQKSLRLPAAPRRAPVVPDGADLKVPGLGPFITPSSSFYRVDTAIVLPEIPPASWQLRIHGMVSKDIVLAFDDLVRRPLLEDYITLTCVSNPVSGPYVGNARWLGVSLGRLLREAGIRAGADQLFCTSFDGFTSGSPVQTAMDGRDAMLAFAMNGRALPVQHGFPVRMVVPGLYGYVSACKWITDIEVTTYASNQAYWAQRGWSKQAPIKTESRIDVPNGLGTLKPGKVAVAGVAWAQHRGIDAVEVRIDHGPWNQARLGAVPGIDTWRQWVYDWDATAGGHLIEARATDKTGYTQTAIEAPPEPNGASGYPVVNVTVTG